MAMGLVEVDRMEPRMMESMAEMGENMTAGLQAELHSTEVQLSHWVAEREQRLADLQARFEQSMEARANEVLDLRKAGQEETARQVHCVDLARQQEERLQEEVRRLEKLKATEDEELPAKLEVLGAERERVAQGLEAKRGEMAKRRYLKEDELSELGRGVLLYKRLGLEFEGGIVGGEGTSSCLRLIFRQISREDPERPFVIAVNIDDNGVYLVPECVPALPAEQFEALLADVNRTNDFGSFVSRVRRCFVALAEAGR